MSDWDRDELRVQLEVTRRSFESLVDKLICADEADDEPWAAALRIAIKTTSSQIKSLRRRLTLEVAS